MQPPRVFLIDASIYIFRAWHSYETSITDREGQPANAVFGFSDFLYQLMRQARPLHIACAFDQSQRSSFRREIFPEYKANREPAPPELKRQFEQCRQFCRVVGIAEFGSERYEADDIIATLARLYREQGFAITVVTADKDLTQVITGEHDRWWDFARGVQFAPHDVKRHFGVHPSQIADLLALSGDKIDNVPGIPGVGYATAAKLLQKFGNLETVLDNHDHIGAMKFRGAQRVQALLKAHRHLLPRNKLLTQVAADVELTAAPELRWRGLEPEAFQRCCDELSLRGLLQQRWFNLAT